MANTRYVNPGADTGGDGTTSALTGANCAYKSLSIWEAARNATLSTPEIVYCAGSTVDATACTISGWVTTAGNYIEIIGDWDPVTDGKYVATKYKRTVPDVNQFTISNATDLYLNIHNIQIYNTDVNTDGIWAIYDSRVGAGIINIHSCCFRGNADPSWYDGGVYINSSPGTYNIYNNFIYDWGDDGSAYSGFEWNGSNTCNFENNTLLDNTVGIKASDLGLTARNNIVKGSGNTQAYMGTFTLAEANATDGTDAGGATTGKTSYVSVTAWNFVSEATDDFHLTATSAGVIDLGMAVGGGFTDDIDGVTRAGTWDIGADEYVAAGGELTAFILSSLRLEIPAKQFVLSRLNIETQLTRFILSSINLERFATQFTKSSMNLEQFTKAYIKSQLMIENPAVAFILLSLNLERFQTGFINSSLSLEQYTANFIKSSLDIESINKAFILSSLSLEFTDKSFILSSLSMESILTAFVLSRLNLESLEKAFIKLQANLETESNVFIQARINMENAEKAFIQAQANLETVNQAFIQAQANLETESKQYIKAQANLETVNKEFVKSQVNLETEQKAFIQAQINLESLDKVFIQSSLLLEQVAIDFIKASLNIGESIDSAFILSMLNLEQWASGYIKSSLDMESYTYQYIKSSLNIEKWASSYLLSQIDLAFSQRAYIKSQANLESIGKGFIKSQTELETQNKIFIQSSLDINAALTAVIFLKASLTLRQWQTSYILSILNLEVESSPMNMAINFISRKDGASVIGRKHGISVINRKNNIMVQ